MKAPSPVEAYQWYDGAQSAFSTVPDAITTLRGLGYSDKLIVECLLNSYAELQTEYAEQRDIQESFIHAEAAHRRSQ